MLQFRKRGLLGRLGAGPAREFVSPRRKRMSLRVHSLLTLVLLAVSFPLQGQQAPASSGQASDPNADQSRDQSKSLADVARENKQEKAKHAKKLITNEDLDAEHGPFPRLDLEGEDNSDEVIRAIGEYHTKHTREEMEQALRDWYEEHDAVLSTAIREDNRTRERRDANVYNGYWNCQFTPSYRNCVIRRQAEMRGAHDDQIAMRQNGFVVGRLQQDLMKIRGAIARYSLQYDWFKIRYTNGTKY